MFYIKFLIGLLPWEQVIYLIIGILENIAAATDNPVDDQVVDIIASLLMYFVGDEDKKKEIALKLKSSLARGNLSENGIIPLSDRN